MPAHTLMLNIAYLTPSTSRKTQRDNGIKVRRDRVKMASGDVTNIDEVWELQ